MLVSAAVLPAAAAEQPPIPGQLTRYVPADVWLIFGNVHTPEREVVWEHWSRVYNALSHCGIERELRLGIASGLPEASRAEFERTWETFANAFRGIKWRDLTAQEIVFAERISTLFPDIIVLMRPAPATHADNVKGLADVMRTLASFAKNGELVFTEQQISGVNTWSIDLRNAPVGLCLLQKDDVVGLVMGQAGRNDVIALLAGQAATPSIADSPRFRAALADVPVPEHAYGFMDFARLFEVVPSFPRMIMGMAEVKSAPAVDGTDVNSNGPTPQSVEAWLRVFSVVLDHFDVLDYIAVSGNMDNEQEYAHTLVRTKPSSRNKPVYRMIANRAPIENVHRYLPVECTSFAASTFVDLGELYRLILSILRDHVPTGASLCDKWRQTQQDWGWNVEEDLLNWIGGEVIYFTSPLRTPSPFGGEEQVCLFRVTDREKAKVELAAGVDRLVALLSKHGQPLNLTPVTDLPAEGFRRINHPLLAAFMVQPCFGVWEDWLVFATSDHSLRLMLETAADKHDSILKNERFRQEGIIPNGPVTGITFSDMSKLGEEMAASFIAMGFVAGSIPDQPETRPIRAIFRSLGSLGPVVSEINFYSSMGSVTTFADGAWRTTTKTTYKPAARTAQSKP